MKISNRLEFGGVISTEKAEFAPQKIPIAGAGMPQEKLLKNTSETGNPEAPVHHNQLPEKFQKDQ
jgi:hypothetical protein